MDPVVEAAAQKAASSAMGIYRDAGALGIERGDFLQEAAIAILLRQHNVPDDSDRPFRLWQIGRSACIDFVRKFNGRGLAAKQSDRRTDDEEPIEKAGPEQWALDPEAHAIAIEALASIQALPWRFRIIVVLLAHGFTQKEIADFHKVSESWISHVRADMPRLLRRISKRYKR